MGLTHAKVVGSEHKIVVSLSGVIERCVHQGTPLRGYAHLSRAGTGVLVLHPL